MDMHHIYLQTFVGMLSVHMHDSMHSMDMEIHAWAVALRLSFLESRIKVERADRDNIHPVVRKNCHELQENIMYHMKKL